MTVIDTFRRVRPGLHAARFQPTNGNSRVTSSGQNAAGSRVELPWQEGPISEIPCCIVGYMDHPSQEDLGRRLERLAAAGVDLDQLRLWRSWTVDERLQHLEEFLEDMADLREEARVALGPRPSP
jgi:hypothetical protein